MSSTTTLTLVRLADGATRRAGHVIGGLKRYAVWYHDNQVGVVEQWAVNTSTAAEVWCVRWVVRPAGAPQSMLREALPTRREALHKLLGQSVGVPFETLAHTNLTRPRTVDTLRYAKR